MFISNQLFFVNFIILYPPDADQDAELSSLASVAGSESTFHSAENLSPYLTHLGPYLDASTHEGGSAAHSQVLSSR